MTAVLRPAPAAGTAAPAPAPTAPSAGTVPAVPTAAGDPPEPRDRPDLDALAAELDALRAEVLDSLGPDDEAYLRRLLRLQRRLDLAGRLALTAGVFPPAWVAGVGLLGLAKILENMELGHNVLHGQWDWLGDPAVHSTTWEWDNACPSEQWRHSHNELHHQWTNVLGMDRDIGYGALRVRDEQPWSREHLAQPLVFVVLALLFEYGVSVHDNEHLRLHQPRSTDWDAARPKLRQTAAKVRRQAAKDYLWWPLLAAPFGPASVLAAATGAAAANVVRNVWSCAVIFCGHFPDGVEAFDAEDVVGESRGEWYRRQILGSANFTGGPVLDVLTGNLDHQIEHHCFPDLPSHRYAELAPRVQEICERHGLAYRTGSFARQLTSVVRTVLRLSLPPRPGPATR